MRSLALLGLLAALAGCADGESVVLLTIRGASLSDVDHLSVAATVTSTGKRSNPETVAGNSGAFGERIVPLVFPAFVNGTVHLTVSAFKAGAAGSLADGATDVVVSPSKTTNATVTLGGPDFDLGNGDDFANADLLPVDIAGADLSPADLTYVDLKSTDLAGSDMTLPTMQTAGACTCSVAMDGKMCVVGELFDFLTNTKTATGHSYKVAAWDPLTFLGATGGSIQEVSTTTGCYTLPGFFPPAINLVLLVITDDSLTPTAYPVFSGVSATGGGAFQFDGFILPISTVQGWSKTGSDGGAVYNYEAAGGVMAFFLDNPFPTDHRFVLAGSAPVPGVAISVNGTRPSDDRYLSGASRAIIDLSLQFTSVQGAVIIQSPASIVTVTGMGGTCGGSPCQWPTLQGGGRSGYMGMQPLFRN